MLSLRELQRHFVAGLLDDEPHGILDCIASGGAPAIERLRIYRGNCREGFLLALGAGFPVIERLCGSDYFRQLVRDYQRAHPSPSGNLAHAGVRFPAFLRQRFTETPYEYFADVATLEWACQEVVPAADHPGPDLARLGRVAAADCERLRFELDPALRLVESRYPIVSIWEAHQDGHEPGRLDLASGGERAAVRRRGAGVALYRLPAPEFACLAALRGARTLGYATGEALAADPAFDLQAALLRWVRLGFIADFAIPGQSSDA